MAQYKVENNVSINKYKYVLYTKILQPMVEAASSPSWGRGEAGRCGPFLASLAFSCFPAQRKNDPGPILRCVQGPDHCPGHIGLPVVTMSTRAFVRDTVPDSHYSLCPFLPAVPIKWFISRNLGRAARFWAEEGGMGTILWNKGLAAKGHNSQSQMPLPHTLNVAFIPPFTRSFIQYMFNEDLVLSQTCGIHWWTTEARPPHPIQRSWGRQTWNKLLTGAFK